MNGTTKPMASYSVVSTDEHELMITPTHEESIVIFCRHCDWEKEEQTFRLLSDLVIEAVLSHSNYVES